MKNSIAELIAKKVKGKPEAYIALVGAFIIIFIILLAIFAPFIAPYDPIKSVGKPLTPPNDEFIFGTDSLGRDLFSRVVYGARIPMIVALLSGTFSLLIGAPLGLLSGYIGGKTDRILSLLMDSIYAFPGLILAIAIAAVLGPGIMNMALAITVVYIPTYFRMVRGQTLSIRESLFVVAARAIGARDMTIMWNYILPNVIPTIAVVFSLNVADAILTEAGLSFFGLGVAAPTPDWGFDLRSGRVYLPAGYWWLVTFPGIMVIIATIGFSLLGEGLSEILNPKLKEE
ncbi:MAG: ABC transporter permease [Candidatus Hydrothermarchaeota archaeon]|nr:MAG: ABC transporter permease [Candidatus Hydrothermarchaeota archaeon]